MLRASTTTTGTELDLAAIDGDAESAAAMAHGVELVRFAEALARRDEKALDEARAELLRAAGPRVLVDAAGVAANFQRMVRIADATGIPVDDMGSALSGEIRDRLGLDRFPSARNTLGAG
jgi:hypothetical protein